MKFHEWLDSIDEDNLDELFDKIDSMDVKNVHSKFITEYTCTVDGREYRTRIMKYDNGVYEILFYMKDGNDEITGITNFGKGNEVLGGVLSAVRQFIKKYKPQVFQLSSYGAKRTRVYKMIANRYFPEYDMEEAEHDELPMNILRFTKTQ
jgi:hypothetical protein